MAGPLGRFITKAVTNALTKRGAPSRGEKAALTRAANKAGMSVTEFKKEAKAELKGVVTEVSDSDKAVAKRLGISVVELKKKRKASLEATKKKPKVTHTKKEKKELGKLIKEHKAAKKGIEPSTEPPGGTIKVLRRPGKDISPQGSLPKLKKEWKSLSINKKIAERSKGKDSKFWLVFRHLGPGRIEGLKSSTKQRPKRAKVEAPGFVGKGTTPYRSKHQMSASQKAAQEPGEKIKHTLEGTPQLTRRQVAEAMGLTGKGKLPTAKELEAMGGFRTNKHGGTVKRNKGGAVRGVGQATKGFGNATYSRKMY